jgi:hypothetical protein
MNHTSQDESNSAFTPGTCRASSCRDCPRADCRSRLNRRQFLGLTAAAAGGWFLGGGNPQSAMASPVHPLPSPALPKVKIYTVYLGGAGAWPKPEFNAPAEKAKFEKFLASLLPRLPEVELVGGDLVINAAEAVPKITARDDVAGVLCIHLGINGDLAGIVACGKPVVVFSQPYSGHQWMYASQAQRAGQRLVLMASRDWQDLYPALALLKAVGQMRQSRILLASAQAGARSKDIRQQFGPEIIEVTTEQMIAAHQAVNEKLATETAQSLFINPARRIVEPSRAEIVKSAKMYLAMKQLLADQRAQAIAVNCLGGIPIQILGYPCLGFAQLCDEGLVGACEADLDSTLTMLLFAYAFGKPGFITDPLFDTSKNAVIHAHCVSPTRMNGRGTPRAAFNVRTHRDDNSGASLEVAMRVGQTITCAKFIDDEAMLVSTGKIIEGKPRQFDDRGCRTQITVAVDGDARKMMDNWSAAMKKYRDIRTLLHRVVFYGDHTRSVQHLASLMGFRVIPEC